MEKKSFSTLLIVAHPYLEKSRANRAVVQAVQDVPRITVRRLYDLYPYFNLDVAAEQELLLRHDLIVMQHPLYWYSMPALLKLWVDEVLQSGWAYGPGGDQLRGKQFLLSITAGGAKQGYSPEGSNRFDMETLLSPWNQTVHLCHMKWHTPKILHASIHASAEQLQAHALDVRQALIHFAREGSLP